MPDLPIDSSPRRPWLRGALVLAVVLSLTGNSAAADERLREQDAVREAMTRSPNLQAALHDQRRALEQVVAADGTYVPRLSFDAGVTHTETPRLTADSTTVSTTDSIDLGSELSHTFPWGTSLSARLEANRVSYSSQLFPGDDRLVTTGPGYGILGRVTVVQPLLRGFGTEVGESELRQSRLSQTAAERARDRAASEILRDVVVTYWELWYAERALAIEREAGVLAERRRDDARERIAAGAEAPVEGLTFETRAAELEQSALAAEAQWLLQSLRLGLLMGRDPRLSERLHAAEEQTWEVLPRDREAVLEAAKRESHAVAQLEAELALSQEQARVAGESERPRLDLEGYLQAQGLGNEAVPPAFEQLGTFGAVSAHVGLVFEIPLSGTRRNAQRRAADAAIDATQSRLLAAELQAQSQAASELVSLEQARRRVALATTTVSIAQRNVSAQQKRYELGDAIPLEIHGAEDELRRARLSLQRAHLEAVQAAVRLDHLTGELLRRYANLIPKGASPLAPRRVGLRAGPF